MIAVTITYEDGSTISTNINGTIEEARAALAKAEGREGG